MSEENRSATPAAGGQATRIRQQLAEEPRWKKFLLVGAVVFMVVGLVLIFVEGGTDPESTRNVARGGGGGVPAGGAGFTDGGVILPDGDAGRIGAAAEGEGKWAPVFLRFGFSFFVGYALGFASRAVMKLTLLFCGLFAMLLFGFSEFGFVDVRWDAMGSAFDGLIENIKSEAGSIKGLFTGRLPSAGLAMLGLYAGFRRG